jgi:hypothetical protein
VLVNNAAPGLPYHGTGLCCLEPSDTRRLQASLEFSQLGTRLQGAPPFSLKTKRRTEQHNSVCGRGATQSKLARDNGLASR